MKRFTEIESATSREEIEAILNEAVLKHDSSAYELSVGLNRIKAIYFKTDNSKPAEGQEQEDKKDFKAYLKEEKIKLPYSTAQNYARIGQLLEEYKEELKETEYEVENGLNKLKYVKGYSSFLWSEEGKETKDLKDNDKSSYYKKALREFKTCSFKKSKELAEKGKTDKPTKGLKITNKAIIIDGEEMYAELMEIFIDEIKLAIKKKQVITSIELIKD